MLVSLPSSAISSIIITKKIKNKNFEKTIKGFNGSLYSDSKFADAEAPNNGTRSGIGNSLLLNEAMLCFYCAQLMHTVYECLLIFVI